MNLGADELFGAIGLSKGPSRSWTAEPVYHLRFGPIELEAAESSPFGTSFIQISGVIDTGRTIEEVDSKIPAEFAKLEEGLAWLAEALRGRVPDQLKPPWLHEGENLRHLLPWMQDRLQYEARPRCDVERPWFRLASKKLRDWAASAPPDAKAQFSFDGSCLRIDMPHGLLAMPASGAAWAEPAIVSGARLSGLPKRLSTDPVKLSIWREQLLIAGRSFPLVL